ncbi:MAG: sulfotransferase family 2 domain-containing protein, partial [Symploca sp. SIO2G7]|nr:sulfotransferase family 2 domain-containing protein [Symploca sp. SIO2G7]
MGIKGKIKNAVVYNLCRSYILAKWINILSLKQTYKKNESGVVIFQMGKVGSSSIYESLKAAQLEIPIYHAHVLTSDRLKATEELARTHWQPCRNPIHLWHSFILSDELRKRHQQKWKVITLVRDPIARNVSAFFETLHLLEKSNQQKLMTSNDGQDLTQLFLSKFYAHDAPINWFDDELKPVFEIDVF